MIAAAAAAARRTKRGRRTATSGALAAEVSTGRRPIRIQVAERPRCNSAQAGQAARWLRSWASSWAVALPLRLRVTRSAVVLQSIPIEHHSRVEGTPIQESFY